MNTRIASVDKSEKANILLLFSDKRFEKKKINKNFKRQPTITPSKHDIK